MFRESFWGLSGFDELKKYIKQGNEFCREVSSIMQERADMESTYAKNLAKLSAKLTKSVTGCVGTLASAWGMAATEMEAEAELHRSLSQALHDDLSKPIKHLADTQYKTRKPIEAGVEKALKYFTDRRSEESKCKKASFISAKDREKMIETLANSRNNVKFKEKDIAKMEKQVRKGDDSMRKADREYHEVGQKAEVSRLEWEAAVAKGTSQMQQLEEERVNQMQDFLNKYNSHLSVIGPKIVSSCERLGDAVVNVNLQADIRTIIDQKGTGPHQPEQLLPDFYAEDMTNQMDKDRRRQALQNYLIYLQQDIEKELKGKEGVEKLVEVYQNKPSFADSEAQEDTRLRLLHVNAMLNFLEASHYKISCSVAQLESRPKPHSKYSDFIEHTKDKQGLATSKLKLPMQMMIQTPTQVGASSRLPADGGQIDSPYHTEKPLTPNTPDRQTVYFSDDGEFDEFPDQARTVSQCRVLYKYDATQYDELTIEPGDIINVYEKQADGWWQGELRGKVGIFPATYVQEA